MGFISNSQGMRGSHRWTQGLTLHNALGQQTKAFPGAAVMSLFPLPLLCICTCARERKNSRLAPCYYILFPEHFPICDGMSLPRSAQANRTGIITPNFITQGRLICPKSCSFWSPKLLSSEIPRQKDVKENDYLAFFPIWIFRWPNQVPQNFACTEELTAGRWASCMLQTRW